MRILISGAGVAGLSTAINLGADGHDVTIVERADHLRVNGSPIDIRGESIDVADKMGVLSEIDERRVDMTERVQFVDRDGAVVAEIPEDLGDSPDDIEIPREDLTNILHGHLGPSVELRFEESIAHLDDRQDGVDVRFASGAADRYDLVVGADGMHSAVRRLTFGPEQQFLRHLGFYTALAALPDYTPSGSRQNPMYNFPGHLAGIAAYQDKALAVLIFRSPWIDYDYHDLDAQKRILADAFAGHDEWRVPELVGAAVDDPELYFDSVSQIHMPAWHRGRIILVGDAAHCASPLSGRGTSLALTGAWLFAEALREHPGDLDAAVEQYERLQQPHVVRCQATAAPGGDRLIPATQEQIDERNRGLGAPVG